MLLLKQPRDWHRRSNDRNNGLLPDLPTEMAITSKPLIKYVLSIPASSAIRSSWRILIEYGKQLGGGRLRGGYERIGRSEGFQLLVSNCSTLHRRTRRAPPVVTSVGYLFQPPTPSAHPFVRIPACRRRLARQRTRHVYTSASRLYPSTRERNY